MGRGPHLRTSRPKFVDDETAWTVPSGFVEVAPMIYQPAQYQPTPWEILPPTDLSTRTKRIVEYRKCELSLPYFAFRYAWTLHADDPEYPQYRRVPATPYLRALFTALQQVENAHIEKSRQMLMSWALMVLFLWDINFHDNWSNLCVSKKEKLVDDGAGGTNTTNSLLGKIRVMHERLPPFLFHRYRIVKLHIENVERNSSVKGEAGQADAGRSGTYRRLLMDEAAYIPNGESVFKAARQASKTGTILNSTPNGKGNVHARIRFAPHTTFRRFSFHWIEHPDKSKGVYCECGWRSDPDGALPKDQFQAHACVDTTKPRKARSPWYDNECRDLRPDQIGSELDISYDTSVRGRVFDAFRNTYDSVGGHVLDHTLFRRRLTHNTWSEPLGPMREDETLAEYQHRYLRHALDPTLPVFTTWDIGISDPTVVLLGQEVSPDGPIVRWLDGYRNTQQGWRHYHQYIVALWMQAWQDVGGADIHEFQHYGDPYGKNRDSDLRSWFSNLASADPPIVVQYQNKDAKGGSLHEWLDYINDQYRESRSFISEWCSMLTDATAQYHFPIDEETGEPLPGKHDPVHDQFSHPCDAKRYLYKFRYAHFLHRQDEKHNDMARLMALGSGRGPVKRRQF